MRSLVVLCVAVLFVGSANAEAARVEIPIHQTVLRGGWIRYSIPLRLGTTDVEAMLDTGSTGLRILPGTLAPGDYTASHSSTAYPYGSGVELTGVTARGALALGALTSGSPVTFIAVQSVGCVDRIPDCAASRISQEDFRIGGDGLKGQGFKAIFGINLVSTEVDNPLIAMGVESWIVLLPVPGDTVPGKLVLNPSADETAGYSLFHLADPRHATFLPGCIVADDLQQKICGRVVLDSGAPGIMVASREVIASFPWPSGTEVTFVVQNEEGRQSGMRFKSGSEASYAVRLNRKWAAPFVRISGAAPFLSLSVLYDAKASLIGLKPR